MLYLIEALNSLLFIRVISVNRVRYSFVWFLLFKFWFVAFLKFHVFVTTHKHNVPFAFRPLLPHQQNVLLLNVLGAEPGLFTFRQMKNSELLFFKNACFYSTRGNATEKRKKRPASVTEKEPVIEVKCLDLS